MARSRSRSRSRARSSVSLSFEQQLALFAVAAAVVVAGLAIGATPLGSPAGQQFAVVNAPNSCADSDGVDFSNSGTVVNVLAGGQKTFSDYCASPASLAEYYCSGNTADIVYVDCPGGCALGRCA